MTINDVPKLSQEWRELHAAAGDDALHFAAHVMVPAENLDESRIGEAQAWAAIATAHYAAANVRAKLQRPAVTSQQVADFLAT